MYSTVSGIYLEAEFKFSWSFDWTDIPIAMELELLDIYIIHGKIITSNLYLYLTTGTVD